MEIILLERVAKLGALGQVVKVKDGFARNFLLRRGKALRATDANKAKFETQRAVLEAKNAERRKGAQAEAQGLDGKSFVIIRQAGESGQLYGSVIAPRHRRSGLHLRCGRRTQPRVARYADQDHRHVYGNGCTAPGSGSEDHHQRCPLGR